MVWLSDECVVVVSLVVNGEVGPLPSPRRRPYVRLRARSTKVTARSPESDKEGVASDHRPRRYCLQQGDTLCDPAL